MSRHVHARSLPPASVDEAVRQSEVVILGEVIDLVEGRREILDNGSDPSSYIQWYDIVIRQRETFKGAVAQESDIHVEFIWPRNLPIDELKEALPKDRRAVVLGNRSEGIDGDTPHVLLDVPSHGLILEDSSGATVLPFEHDKSIEAVVRGAPSSFAELQVAIARDSQP